MSARRNQMENLAPKHQAYHRRVVRRWDRADKPLKVDEFRHICYDDNTG